jgi:tetratricopeptide (TPR) repeat protein
MDIGQRIKALRRKRGLTQTELAAPHYSAAYVSTIEAGKRRPSQQAVQRLAEKLGVDPDELASGRSAEERSSLLRRYVEARHMLASGDSASAKEAETELARLAKDALRRGYKDIEGKAAFGHGLAAELNQDLDEALARYEQLEKALENNSPLSRVDVVVARARVLQTKGDVVLGTFLLERALAELASAGLQEPSALVRLHSSLVAAYFNLGLMEKAASAAQVAIDLSADVEDPERLANMNLNVAIMLMKQEKWKEAETHFAAAENWFGVLDYRTDLAKVHLARGLGLRDRGDIAQARSHLQKAQAIFNAAGQHVHEARAAGALAIAERLEGNLDAARFLLKRSITLAGGDAATEGIAYRELGLCDASADRSKALKHLRKAITVLKGAGHARELAATYRELGNLLSGDPDLRDACEAYRVAADLFENAA